MAMKNIMIACCGLDCGRCDAHIATVNDDDALREKTARLWSKLNGVTITKDMINCDGCRADGTKTVYCESLCPIRQCAMGKGFETCGDCDQADSCEKVGAVVRSSPDARRNLCSGPSERAVRAHSPRQNAETVVS